MFCAKCGAANTDANKFCMGCGVLLLAGPPIAPVSEHKAPAAPVSKAPAAGVAGTVGKACPLCAQTYPASQKFCNFDGAALVANATALATPSDPQPELRNEASAPVAAPLPLPAPATLPVEPQAAATPEPPVGPPPPAPPTIKASAEGLACPSCGLAFPPGVRFCDQDGTTLVGMSAAQAVLAATRPPVLQSHEEPSWDSEWDDLQDARKKRTHLVAGLLFVAVLIASGGGYAYWNGYWDTWIGGNADPELASVAGKDSPKSVGNAETKPATPGLLGKYKAHLSDQDIVLVIEGEAPKPLVASAGTVTYLNIVNGGTCTAALVPTSGDGVGGDTGNAVSFQQTPVPGKPNCPKDIPVKMDITGQPAGEDGVVSSIAVEWHKPNSENVLMAGKLQRETR